MLIMKTLSQASIFLIPITTTTTAATTLGRFVKPTSGCFCFPMDRTFGSTPWLLRRGALPPALPKAPVFLSSSWKTHHREKRTTPLSSSKSGKTCAESPRRREPCRVASIQFLPLTLTLLNQKALAYRDTRKADLRGWRSLGNWGSPHPIGKSL